MKHIIRLFQKKQQRLLLSLLILLVVLAGYLLVRHDAFLYQDDVIQVTDVIVTPTGSGSSADPAYLQKTTAKVLNGKWQGYAVTFESTYTDSHVNSEQYHRGDQIFAKVTEDGTTLTASVLGVKRDHALYLLSAFFIFFLLLFSGRRGFFILLSLIVNISAFYFCLKYVGKETFLETSWMFLAALFCLVTLVFSTGLHKKTFAAFFASVITIAITALLFEVTIYTHGNFAYDMMPDMVYTIPPEQVYRVSVIIGLLGAVMDVAITVISSSSEIAASCSSLKAFVHSIREIGYDIMGSMISVLFFSYFSGALSMMVLELFHGFTLASVLQYILIFDAGRFLIGSIGIVLCIPVSGLFAVLLFWKGGQNL